MYFPFVADNSHCQYTYRGIIFIKIFITITVILWSGIIIVTIAMRCRTYTQDYVAMYGLDGDPGLLRVMRDFSNGQFRPQIQDAGQDATRNRRRRRD